MAKRKKRKALKGGGPPDITVDYRPPTIAEVISAADRNFGACTSVLADDATCGHLPSEHNSACVPIPKGSGLVSLEGCCLCACRTYRPSGARYDAPVG